MPAEREQYKRGPAVGTGQTSGESGASAEAVASVGRAYAELRAAYEADRHPSLAARDTLLSRLIEMLRAHGPRLSAAASADFGFRSRHDTELGDLWLSLSQLRHVRSQLPRWMAPRRERPLLVFRPATARVVPQPLGVVGIIAPWNYPIMLAMTPLAGALAAGNRVMLKLSEHTPKTSALLAELIEQTLPPGWVRVVRGGVDVGRAMSQLRFDHLLFTGNERAGREIAEAAARNLVPVTLELGGKSPAILHGSFPVAKFAERVVQGKFFNAGQSCVAPDYLLVPSEQVEEVIGALRQRVTQCFASLGDNPDYTAVASEARKQRLLELVAEARDAGARVEVLNPANENLDATQKLAPTLLIDVPETVAIAREEVFGPVLSIVPYEHLDDALDYVNRRPRPLALYYFDRDADRIQRVISETTSGGVTINDTLLHFLCDRLPRTAIGDSGQGAYLGRRSFEAFSHHKSVVFQSRLSGVGSFAPPYGRWVDWVLRRVLRV